MKLCFLANVDSIHSKKWIEYFANKGNEVHWITLTSNYFSKIKKFEVYRFKKFLAKPLEIILNTASVRKLIKKINPDILHAHYAGVNGILAALSGFHPFVLTVWGSDILINANSRIMKPLIKFVLKKTDLITCDAEHMKEAMIKLGVNASKIKIIRFGIDTQKFSPGPKDEKIIKDLNSGNSPLIISLRSLEPIYDVETLIKSISLVLKEVPDAKFIIAGNGSGEEKLKNLVRSLKIEENVKFIGFVPNDYLPKYLRTADIYISTSLSDAGIAASTAEAMACGLSVVITNTGENKKWVNDGKSGYLIQIKNPQILAKRIISLLRNENQRVVFGKKAREIIKEKNNYYKEMAKMEEIYRGLIEK